MVFMRDPMAQSINKKLGFRFVNTIFLTLDKKSVPRDAQEAAELKESIAKLMVEDETDLDEFQDFIDEIS